ncbi:hypothetical protein PBI_THOTH_1 [Mycobacterium phage Thoth]|uniref:Uncharacterized protein n=3 Tax=Plotvirus plot TaxID=2170099 RepID=B5U3M9_9CAUD|nr:gp1 [Mycobacterium phage Gumball]AEK10211.1 hypothetical protein PBI_SIRHARLEY_1 [Mycobacterium phage SirHarley]AER49754.1 hypothetical protein NOVA_1 [Mycobacterium phage Nova]QOP65964.1 hypothetical protein PBI_THOTH_1 [Mycobacterium phage Thoth]WNN93713.1 hypothetical protein SEA_MOPEY_1 [Mycobacterium phage Mopey]ACI06375.1 hypothetical protein GUMBALL_1 [Mycobacterium phage Gumball]
MTEPGASEFSWGPGMHPHPDLDYDAGKSLAPNNVETLHDQIRDLQASKRTNAARAGETMRDMYFALGNPDRYGPNPALVQGDGKPEPSPTPEESPQTFERKP